MQTFLWHDYETWGIDPALDKPAQFAAIRTDSQLQPVAEPCMLYCQPAVDTLPQPEACLVTKLTPQFVAQQGIPEYRFAQQIHQLMMQPQTCVVGYNNIRFDDEVTRHTFFRNFLDPYEREYKNGNSRFDLIDVVRLCAALRPEGIAWPQHENGLPSFKLEDLTAANQIAQTGAHDALVDVQATIELARLIQTKQPKLWQWALNCRSKQFVTQQLKLGELQPVLHVSGMFKSAFYHASLVLPFAQHPHNSNELICYDLRVDPEDLLTLSADAIRERLFSASAELAGAERIALKNIHINKCPMVAPVSLLDAELAERIQLDRGQSRAYYQRLKDAPDLQQKLLQVFAQRSDERQLDVEKTLYSGGFPSRADKALCAKVQSMDSFDLAGLSFEDPRFNQLLFRYRARHFPETLSESESWRWRDQCMAKFNGESAANAQSLSLRMQHIQQLAEQQQDAPERLKILQSLWQWLEQLA